MKSLERSVRADGYQAPAGLDEAGRGPWAGPVVAAACILDEDTVIPGLDDSKKLTPAKREALFESMTRRQDLRWAYGLVSAEEIDRVNILEATKSAMRQAISKFQPSPDYLLIDGLPMDLGLPGEAVVKGDQKVHAIAAASIIAKVLRDRLMVDLDRQFPGYGFAKHKGYGTQAHREALQRLGPCAIHRKSFAPIKKLLLGSAG
jgi:ribonuclease HII